MQRIMLALAATAGLGSAALAQGYPVQGYPAARPYAPAPARMLSPDELRDYHRDQLDRRQEAERDALRMHQKAVRRALGLDDD